MGRSASEPRPLWVSGAELERVIVDARVDADVMDDLAAIRDQRAEAPTGSRPPSRR